MMSIDVSIVIATWKRPELLTSCVRALINQSFHPHRYEIIVVTDGPDMLSLIALNLVKEEFYSYPDLQCISLAQKKGPAAARNAGWQMARGSLIVFTDDDCIPLFFCVENYWKAYIHKRYHAIAFSGRLKVPLQRKPTDHEKNIARLERARFVTANCACSRKALEITGGLDEEFTMAWREDTALEFNLLEHSIPIEKVEGAIIVHPVREAPWGVSIPSEKKNMFNALLFKKHPHLYRSMERAYVPRYYYVMIGLFLVSLVSAFVWPLAAAVALSCWLLFTAWFAIKRLKGTTKRPTHVLEMLYTSALIPFHSVYWSLYGSIRFKTKWL